MRDYKYKPPGFGRGQDVNQDSDDDKSEIEIAEEKAKEHEKQVERYYENRSKHVYDEGEFEYAP